MKPLTIELSKGRKQEYRFLGWKEDGLAFYATAANGQPAVIIPVSAYPGDSESTKPYSFPRFVPLEITPKRFEIAWGDHHRDVLRRWRQDKLVKVDALTQKELFPFDESLRPRGPRTEAEVREQRRGIKEGIENHFSELMEMPLAQLLDPIAYAHVLDDFRQGQWAYEMGEDFQNMLSDAESFDNRWQCADDPSLPHTQQMIRARSWVQFVMRGSDGED